MVARLAWRMDGTLLEIVFLLGLGGVFLANAAVAVIEPEGFRELVAASPFGALVGDGEWVTPVIAVNDALTGTAVIAAHRVHRARSAILAWAGAWLLVVTLMKLATIGS